jgi:hypothetical protein
MHEHNDIVLHYAQTCTNVHKHARTCTNVHKHAQVCTTVHKRVSCTKHETRNTKHETRTHKTCMHAYCAQTCTIVHKHARTCMSMHKHAQACTIVHKRVSCTKHETQTHEHTNTRNMHAQLLGGWRPSMGWWCSTPQVVVFRVSCFVHVRARSCMSMHAQLLGGWRTSRTAAAASGAHGRTPLGVHQTKNGLLDRLPRTSTRRQERSGAHAR